MKNNATSGQSLRVFPQCTNLFTQGARTFSTVSDRAGNSTYHALILRVTKRYANGLSLLLSYAWSKTLTDADDLEPWIAAGAGSGLSGSSSLTAWYGSQNHYNRRLEKSYGVLDVPYTLRLTASHAFPLGKGKQFLTSGWASKIVGACSVSTFVLLESVCPLGAVDSGYDNYLRGGTGRPNVISNDWRASILGARFAPDKGLFFDSSVFVCRTNPAVDPFGDAARLNGNAGSFPMRRENIAVTRTFRIAERARLNFRWEVFDLFNHQTSAKPGVDLANLQTFGIVTSAAGNRTMQVSMKLSF